MVQSEVIRTIVGETGQTKAVVKEIISELLLLISEQLQQNEPVQFSGFGTFSVRHTAQRKGRNPATGKTITISERFQPKFTAGATLKHDVQTALE